MTKADFINAVHAKFNETTAGAPYVSKDAVGKILDAAGAVALAMLGKGDDLPLLGLGSLKVVQRAAREGRNPRTGETIEIPARSAAKFTASRALKEALK